MAPHILAAPAHYIISDKVGSEYYIAYSIINRVACLDPSLKITALCGYYMSSMYNQNTSTSNRCGNINIIPLYKGAPKLSDVYKAKFYVDLYVKTRTLNLVKKSDIVHHIMPFGYRVTFNLIYKLARKYKRPFIIGPVQSPQIFVGKDEFEGENFIEGKDLLLSINFHRKILAPILHRLFRNTVKNATLLIAATRFAKRLYEEYVDSEKIVVIPFGIDTDIIEAKKYKSLSGNISIMYAGHLILRKGVHYLIQAFAVIARQYRDVELHIYGKGPQLHYLRRLASSLGVGGKVFFHGFIPRDQLLTRYKDHDIYVHPSLSESFGIAILEAMAAGLPVIASDIPNVNEVVKHGKTGFLFKPRSVKELAEYLSLLIEDEKLRKDMGLNAREEVIKHYDWKKIAQKYYEVYKNMTNFT